MSKGALVTVGVLGVLVAGASAVPYWFGVRAEQAYNTHLQKAVDGGQVIATAQRYERGWLSSTAEATLSVPGAPVSLNVTNTIYHGPFPFIDGIDFSPVLARVRSQVIVSVPGAKGIPPISMDTSINLSGESEGRISAPPYRRAAAGSDGGIEWQGIDGTMRVSADNKNVKLDLTAPQLKITAPQGGFVASRATLNVDQTENAAGLTLGTMSVGVEKLTIDATDNQSILEGLRISSTTRESGSDLNAQINIQLRNASDGEVSYGPGQMNIELRKLDAKALSAYQNDMRAMQKQKIPPEQMATMMLGKGLQLVGNLAKKVPEMEITKLSLKIKGGEINGKAKFVLDGANFDVAANPALLMMAFSGEGELLFDEPVLRALSEKEVHEQLEALKAGGKLSLDDIAKLTPQRVSEITAAAVPGQMDKLINRMNLVRDGNQYKVTASIRQGRFLLNGQPIQLGAMP